ncbi:keratin, type I cytoskeletal 9-like [Brassica napus]|uniref:keratin, type I cytoskeletal 9-like n=1 Tax=Brassica napus TaxID=3708 RepID=UPI002079CE22|nr:keratin, type I cytoskeletal 9-like [Brassica napus]
MLKRLLTTSAFSPKGVNWVRSFASGAGKGGFASGAWNVGFSSGAGNGGFASGSASGGDENGGSASGGDGNGGSASGGDGNGGSASGGAGNGGSESENNGGGQRSYRLCPPSLEQKLEDLQKECNQWEDHFRKAKDMFSSQDGDRKEHVKSCEIRSLERYLTYLKEETYIWNVVREHRETSNFPESQKMRWEVYWLGTSRRVSNRICTE